MATMPPSTTQSKRAPAKVSAIDILVRPDSALSRQRGSRKGPKSRLAVHRCRKSKMLIEATLTPETRVGFQKTCRAPVLIPELDSPDIYGPNAAHCPCRALHRLWRLSPSWAGPRMMNDELFHRLLEYAQRVHSYRGHDMKETVRTKIPAEPILLVVIVVLLFLAIGLHFRVH